MYWQVMHAPLQARDVQHATALFSHCESPMHNEPQDHDPATDTSTDHLQERTQRDQEERSRQALSNQGSQDRKPDQDSPDQEREDPGDRGR